MDPNSDPDPKHEHFIKISNFSTENEFLNKFFFVFLVVKALFRDEENFDNLFSSDLDFERKRFLFDILVLGYLSGSLKPKRFGSNRSGS